MNTIQVEIVSAERDIFSGDATMVIAPGRVGDLGIAPRHTPLLTSLRPGDIEVHRPGGEKEFFLCHRRDFRGSTPFDYCAGRFSTPCC